jgi:UDP-N-acetylmuramoyl-L-alanyl-D-glutamate--2,6-diaminopimelate ligase
MQLAKLEFSSQQLTSALSSIGVDLALLSAKSLATRNISLDSRSANVQTGFVALKGEVVNGHHYIGDALERGCKLILCEQVPDAATHLLARKQHAKIVVVDELKMRLPCLLQHLYMTQECSGITAVTGTNGKTSVASLYAQLALAFTANSASLGTLGLNIFSSDHTRTDVQHFDVGVNTTPDIILHYKILRMLNNRGIEPYCLEASSHGIFQQRLAGLPIQTAIFTNLTQDHLDYHGSMTEYGAAKRGLLRFASLKHLVLNADDAESQRWQATASDLVNIVWYGLSFEHIPKTASLYCIAKDLRFNHRGIAFRLISSWGDAQLQLPLLGAFNVANLLAALSAHLVQGQSFDALVTQTSSVFGVAGRMELFTCNAGRANIIVDYAHTPDALKQALIAARQHTAGKLYCVFGCGGDRDKSKRAIMGQVASECSDMVVLTQDNSRTESPENIIRDIQAGMLKNAKVHIELERPEAVKWAWQRSRPDDLILLAGKGHEDYLEINHQRLPYDERAFVQRLCAEAVA